MHIDVRIDGDEAVLVLTGRMTIEDNGPLSERVRDLLGEGYRKFVLDLASVSYVDSAGLGEIVQIYVMVRREGAVLRLEGPNTRLVDLPRVTKLLTMFEGDRPEHIPGPPDPLNPRLVDIRWQFTVGVALMMLVIVGVMLLLR
jgi:anti-sigma B factor antagonist